jgi:hypothetical protein
MKRLMVASIGLVALLAGGCGLARLEKSAEDLQTSKADYEACLHSQPETSCENLKQIYEADLSEYEARHKAASNYGATRVNVYQ